MEQQFIEAKIWEQEVEIPTYPAGVPDKNPMFLEKRVYQGSSGKVYPLPVIDKIYDHKVLKKYRAVFLENEYIRIMVLPELGGRIQRALDKTNNYDFVYYNQVIKPALVGLAGPWISGGIEFNWPQHHRPSTFSPVEYELRHNEDGSKTLWVGEIDVMYGTKGMAGFTIHPGRAYLQIDAKLYNRTPEPQTFLWWANPAVAVNDDTQSVFPPDVHAVLDHGKRDVSKFPVATGVYYKTDYSAGVDISRYKNIPVPTSYMAYRSEFDFVGGYDHGKKAGLLHIADHHVSPGKKQWTWGCGDFGQAWDRNLTDSDGPYIELMTGVYTDNQPDFTWLNPYEVKSFTQYFMPYKDVGMVKNATTDVAVNLETDAGQASITVYATSLFRDATVELKGKRIYIRKKADLSPEKTIQEVCALEEGERETELTLTVFDSEGKKLIAYKPLEKKHEQVPDPAKAIPAPEAVKNNEALYLAGIHLEQYRHATYEPDAYYLEGLKRDPEDIRINNAYGLLLFRRGRFKESEAYFRRALKTACRHNTNPYDGEFSYNLGLSLLMQDRFDEAYDAFYKAVWNVGMQDAGYFSIAGIDARRGDFEPALRHCEKSLVRNSENYRARNLKTALLRKMGRFAEAEGFARQTLALDRLDFGCRNELYRILLEEDKAPEAGEVLSELARLMREDVKNYIGLSLDYAWAGMYREAAKVLERLPQETTEANPMVSYYLGYYYEQLGETDRSRRCFAGGAEASPDYCYPNKLEDILVLQSAIRENPGDARALYYLGNLWYDKKQFDLAIECWESARELDDSFPTVHRNLSLAYFNRQNQPEKARASLEKAYDLNPEDARVLFELDQLYKKTGLSPVKRLEKLEAHMELVERRDDLYVEYITLLNTAGEADRAYELMLKRNFHPWEGGEGKITKQYVYSVLEKGRKLLEKGAAAEAAELMKKALEYPHNLGEGKLHGAQENNINYYIGCAYELQGDRERAADYFGRASVGLAEPASAMFYNDQPPEMIFYQGAALQKLGRSAEAAGRFNKLIDYGELHLRDHVTIDYFAVSLPDFLVFEEDLDRKNAVHCRYLMGLGYLGKGMDREAGLEFKQALALDCNHQGVLAHMKLLAGN
jgi:tetratricopeptide (TPR) repeat protein